jgi:hypothetical protein
VDSSKPFIGKEAEGEDRGENTIFIPYGAIESCGMDAVRRLILQSSVRRLYFGAGNRRGLGEDDISLITQLSLVVPKYRVFVEFDNPSQIVNVPEDLLKDIRIVFVVPVKCEVDRLISISDIKFVNQKEDLVWYNTTPVLPVVRGTDKYYGTDKELI